MPTYAPPLRDMQFVLHELLAVTSCPEIPAFAELSPALVDTILQEAGRFSTQVAFPLNATGDRQGCHLRDGKVFTPDGFRAAYQVYVEGGWPALTGPVEFGGQGLPAVVGFPLVEMLTASNWGFSMYPGLTAHAVTPLHHFASDELKATYLPKMVKGVWSATMNLTEPQAGSDLSLLRARAERAPDGSYRITGTKIFISAGDHDLTENIVHLVLARIQDAPAGVRGISLFVVPKFLPGPDGAPGERNGVRCSRIEEKMGIHSSATCELVYENAVGFLVGEPHRGLVAMFTMMNEARLGAGLQGVAIADIAYQNAAAYTRTRLQGRAPGGEINPTAPADPIVVHPDVRRMLLTIRSIAEGGRALCYWGALQADLSHHHPDSAVRLRSSELLDALTPIVKAQLTDQGLEATSLAMQCLGGHGYVREWGLEQFMRDARIAPIYEGTNGVQALDLVGRKLCAQGGRSLSTLLDTIGDGCRNDDGALRPQLTELRQLLDETREVTAMLQRRIPTEPLLAGAVGRDYLSVLGLLVQGHVWAWMARLAASRLDGGTVEPAFYEAKLATARFFFAHSLPLAHTHLRRVRAGSDPVTALPLDSY